jgi:hypothetical protein
MTEQRWTTDELDRIGGADELRLAPRRKDGTLPRAVPISVVRVGDELYVRSFRGDSGRWYVEPMLAPQARATTLRLVPRSEATA